MSPDGRREFSRAALAVTATEMLVLEARELRTELATRNAVG
jgi:hypothetical protein